MENRTNELILSTSTIEGSTVRSLSDEKIGTIKDIMLDTDSGEVVYVVLSVDTGFLNLGSKYFAIPWQAFSFNSHFEDVFILDIDKNRLENSPGFDKDNWPSGPQREFISQIHDYYGIDSSRRSLGRSTSGMGASHDDYNKGRSSVGTNMGTMGRDSDSSSGYNRLESDSDIGDTYNRTGSGSSFGSDTDLSSRNDREDRDDRDRRDLL
jgi:sporulation protein YlmC with PRC-barrel domain